VTDVLGAEISDVDLSGPLPGDVASTLRQLFLERSLLLFRDQDLTGADQSRFVTSLGPLSTALLPSETAGSSDAFFLSNEYADGRGELRPHSDHCFLDQPLWGISLYAHASPARGGQTVFVSAVAACRNIPDELRLRVEGRNAVHTYLARERLGEGLRDPSVPDALSAQHPVIWPHPVTGVPVLYVNPWMTQEIVGLDPDESKNVLAELLSSLSDPSITYAHSWRPGDFLVWDNVALLHARTEYDPVETRLLERLQLSLP
jgi:taurine dioxygenase